MKKASEERKETAKRRREKQSSFGQRQEREKATGEMETDAGASKINAFAGRKNKHKAEILNKVFPACVTVSGGFRFPKSE